MADRGTETEREPLKDPADAIAHADRGSGTRPALAEPPISWRIVVYVILVALGGCVFGFEISVISGAKTKFASEFDLATDSVAYGVITSSMTIGAMPGTATAGLLQDRLGRKATVVIASLIYIAGALTEFFAHSYGVLLLGRIIVGVGIGYFSSTVPLYIAELAPTSIRGKLVTANQLNVCIGILLGYVVDKVVDEWRFQLGAAIPAVALLCLSFLFITPQSPRWLMMKGRREEARDVLLRIRGGAPSASWVEFELEQIEEASRLTSSSGLAKLLEPQVVRAVLVGVALSFIQQMCGVNAVNFYAQDVLEKAGFQQSEAFLESIFIGVVKVVMIVVAIALMDRAGRKTLLLAGTAGMIVTVVALATILYSFDGKEIPSSAAYGSATCLFLFMGFFEIGQGPVVWLLLSEMYPLSVRGVAMSIGATSVWLFTFVVGVTFPPLEDAIQIYGTFYLYAGIGVLSCVFIHFYVPETRGKNLEDIEDLFREAVGVPTRASGHGKTGDADAERSDP